MLERRDFLLAERGADRDREMASGIQHNAAALVARLQATGTSGVRAALGGSPVAYGSPPAAKCILTRRDCDVNSLTRRGTKSRSGQGRVLISRSALQISINIAENRKKFRQPSTSSNWNSASK